MDDNKQDNNQDRQPVVVAEKSQSTVESKNEDAKKPQSTAVMKPSMSRANKGLLALSLLVAIAAAGGSAYQWQLGLQQQQQLQKLQADMAGSIQRVDQQADDNRELQRQLDRQQDSTKQQQKNAQQQIQTLQQQLTSQQKRLLSLSTTDRTDWLLAEAEYLIRLANQRLLMGKEISGAQALLKAADDIAKELDDSALYPVRQALANDIAALKSAAKFDLEGVYLKLGAVALQVERLSLIKLPELKIATAEEKFQADLQAQAWQQRLQTGFQAAIDNFSHYIQINRRDEIYKPLLAPEYETALRHNVRLMFEQAQMAALAGKQKLYQDSLSKAKQWLRDYYTLDQAATDAIVKTIDELSRQKVEVILPDISASLRALKSYQDMIHQIQPQNTTKAKRTERAEEPAA